MILELLPHLPGANELIYEDNVLRYIFGLMVCTFTAVYCDTLICRRIVPHLIFMLSS